MSLDRSNHLVPRWCSAARYFFLNGISCRLRCVQILSFLILLHVRHSSYGLKQMEFVQEGNAVLMEKNIFQYY